MTNADTTTADVRDDEDVHTARLDRQADAFLAGEGREFDARPALAPHGATTKDETRDGAGGVSSIRQAVRDDIRQGREVARQGTARTRDAIRDEPTKAALYAVGIGVLIGLLVRR